MPEESETSSSFREREMDSQEGQDLINWDGLEEGREVKPDDFFAINSTEAAVQHVGITAASKGDGEEQKILAALALDIATNGAADEPR